MNIGEISETVMCQNEYNTYEELGDRYRLVNCNQAYLCYENAEFLCPDKERVSQIRKKKEEMKSVDGFCVQRASIIIVSYNCMYMMQKCLESIRRTCSTEMCETIIVDNASTDGVREWLVHQEDEKIILLDQNVGFPMGCNIGAEYAESKNDIFLLNNDTRMTPNALFWLRMGLYEKNSVGACGCVANYCGNGQEIDIQFALPNEYVEYGKKQNVYMANPYEERNRLCGFAMLIRRRAWDEVQGMDENFTPGYLDDDDISMKLRRAGYQLVICHNSYIYHAGSQNFSKLENLGEIITRNYIYLVSKWGFDVPQKSLVNQEAIDSIHRAADEEFSVLHIGAGCGSTLARIRYLYPNAIVCGLEECREAVEMAPSELGIEWCETEAKKRMYREKKYDYVIE